MELNDTLTVLDLIKWHAGAIAMAIALGAVFFVVAVTRDHRARRRAGMSVEEWELHQLELEIGRMRARRRKPPNGAS